MADTNATPMTNGDIETPPAGTQFQPADPLKGAGVEFNAEGGTLGGDGSSAGGSSAGGTSAIGGKVNEGIQALRDNAGKFGQQATDKARGFAEDGKSRATDALGQLSQMLNEAAGQVDEKLGAQYGEYARTAATSVQGFADTIKNKDVDALFEDVRGYVRQSPAIAIGVTAALGFAVARLVQSGLDSAKDNNTGRG